MLVMIECLRGGLIVWNVVLFLIYSFVVKENLKFFCNVVVFNYNFVEVLEIMVFVFFILNFCV